ncbi:MAG: acylphosphatase [Gammaproteobacteria bacterium]|nr:acylphosphatase [Gammaproteobacteria bacterium]
MNRCVRFRVIGHVQGVWFRGSAQEQAQRLGLRGWAHNLANGDVEVLACGASAAISELEKWLWKGPRLARVVRVECEEIDIDPPAGFSID